VSNQFRNGKSVEDIEGLVAAIGAESPKGAAFQQDVLTRLREVQAKTRVAPPDKKLLGDLSKKAGTFERLPQATIGLSLLALGTTFKIQPEQWTTLSEFKEALLRTRVADADDNHGHWEQALLHCSLFFFEGVGGAEIHSPWQEIFFLWAGHARLVTRNAFLAARALFYVHVRHFCIGWGLK
jgi:hypothetical protein